MTRVASIHISEQELSNILKTLLNVSGSSVKWDTDSLSKAIVKRAKNKSLSHRSISVTNDKLQKKTEKVKLTNLSDTAKFAKLLTLVRQKLKHRGVKPIKAGDPDWLLLKSIASNANQFQAEFELKKQIAYEQYITIGLSKMKKFSLTKFPRMHEAISNDYEAISKINLDPTPMETKRTFNHYQDIIIRKAGFPDFDMSDDPQKYCVFIEIKDIAKSLGIPVSTYIDAQFEAFSFHDGIPDPLQMIGAKAKRRVVKYCYEHNINLKATSNPSINWKNIKKDED